MTTEQGLHRIDGTVLAAAAELLESQQHIAELLAEDPTNEKFLRLRLQYSQQVGRFSAILGWTAKDRQHGPVQPVDDASELDNLLDAMNVRRQASNRN